MRLEAVVVPVSDVDRSDAFYTRLGFRLDIDYVAVDGFRVVQWTPPGSACSIIIGDGITSAPAGSMPGLHLTVPDLVAARRALTGRRVAVRSASADGSCASFSDPDGNGWLLRLPRRRASRG
jgi:catechol 2,3-dioxygenase-like lactoylglutathione lyase family enzyme